MNIDICLRQCERMGRPRKLVKYEDGQCWLYMSENSPFSDSYGDGDCTCVPVENASSLFETPPNGWSKEKGHKCEVLYLYDLSKSDDAFWKLSLSPKNNPCPYVAEHMMDDIRHEKRKNEWRRKEEARKKLIEERRNGK